MADWEFSLKFRATALGWNGSPQAVQRIKAATAEIRKVAKRDPLRAAEGAIYLFGRFWPAFEQVDSSTGALGRAVKQAQTELIPLIATAPADAGIRSKWLGLLWTALEDDGVGFLDTASARWGELCGSAEAASQWADRWIDAVRTAWTSTERHRITTQATACLSSLLATGRHSELWELLALDRVEFWRYQQFGFQAYVKEGRVDEALAYAEKHAGRQRDPELTVACERVLLAQGRMEDAYARYGISASAESGTGLNTFRAIVKKYPQIEPERILLDLAAASRDCGRYFAAAKEAGFYDLALQFAVQGNPDPATLRRACRDLLEKDPPFAATVGQIAMRRYLDGFGYEIAPQDWADCFRDYAAASRRAGEPPAALQWVTPLAEAALRRKSTMAMARHLLTSIRENR